MLETVCLHHNETTHMEMDGVALLRLELDKEPLPGSNFLLHHIRIILPTISDLF